MSLFLPFARTLPNILQSERAECGLACVCMIAAWHGYDVDLLTLRQQHTFTAMGATLRQLVDVAARIKLSCRPLKVPLESLDKLALPAILHWDLDHFVVLREVRADGTLVIHDPAVGVRRVPRAQASQSYTGVAVEMSRAPDFQPVRRRSVLPFRRLLRGALPSWSPVWHGALFAAIAQTLALCLPKLAQFAVDVVAPSGSALDADMVGLGALAIAVCVFVASLARGVAFVYVGTAIHGHLARGMFRHLLALPLRFFQRQQSAELIARFDSLRSLQRILSATFVEALVDGGAMLVAIAFVATNGLALAAAGVACMSLYAVLRAWNQERFVQLTEEQLIRGARVQANFVESIRGIESIKAHNGLPLRISAWDSQLVAWFNASTRLNAQVAFHSAAALALQVLTFGTCLWLGLRGAMRGELTLGALVASLSLLQIFSFRFTTLVDKAAEYGMLSIHKTRLSDIYAAEAEDHMEPRDALRGHELQGRLTLSGVSFRHAPDAPWTLQEASLDIAPGDFVAITGASGGGKTTLLRVMLGLLEPEHGSVAIDGLDIGRYGKGRYRDRIAAVLQNDVLFSGSIVENICAFDPMPDMAWIEECARMAGLADAIAAMPMGYRTLVGDMGALLSGGQQQRLFLARALYRRPRILFLDEATSHLDVAKEREINASVAALGITRIVFAHRLETIRAAHVVYRLAEGRLVRQAREALEVPA
ncbi:MAG TPA: peptidase domain-containing ABC transporter [Burkholderiaceae bacterium]